MAVPAHASVVIVGGGIAGCSIAYHLTKIGVTDVVLLERRQLTCGTTWHAAGLVGQLRATRNLTELSKYTAGLYRSLEAETGQATGFKQNGSISTAKTPARFEELKRGASMGKTFGLEVEVLSPGAIRERWPLLYVEDLVGGIFLPADGQTNRPEHDVIVGGPLCESGDIFTQEEGGIVCPRRLPEAAVGELLVIECAGAYGFVMGSNYNSRPLAAEVLVEDGRAELVRRRQTFKDLIHGESIPKRQA